MSPSSQWQLNTPICIRSSWKHLILSLFCFKSVLSVKICRPSESNQASDVSSEMSHSTSSQPSNTQISTASAFNSENYIDIGSKSWLSNTSIHNKDCSISDCTLKIPQQHTWIRLQVTLSQSFMNSVKRVCTWLRWSTEKKDGSSMRVSVSLVEGQLCVQSSCAYIRLVFTAQTKADSFPTQTCDACGSENRQKPGAWTPQEPAFMWTPARPQSERRHLQRHRAPLILLTPNLRCLGWCSGSWGFTPCVLQPACRSTLGQDTEARVSLMHPSVCVSVCVCLGVSSQRSIWV